MTDEDIKRIFESFKEERNEYVLNSAERKELKQSMEFYKRCNKILSDSGSTIRNSIIRFMVVGTMVLVTWGCAAVIKMKQADLIP